MDEKNVEKLVQRAVERTTVYLSQSPKRSTFLSIGFHSVWQVIVCAVYQRKIMRF